MATKPTPIAIPGIDSMSMLRGIILVVPLALLLGPQFAPVLVLSIVLIKPLTKLRTQLVGPPMMNQALVDERSRGMLVLAGVLGGGCALWFTLIRLLPDHKQVAALIFFLTIALVLVWFRPSMVVIPLIAMTAVGGSGMLLVAVPLVIMLARRDQRMRLTIPRSLRRTAMTVLYALAGLLLVLFFANASAGAPQPGSASQAETPASPTNEDTWFDQASDWLLRRDGTADLSAPSRPVQVPGQGQGQGSAPPDSTPWQLWLALAAGVVALVAAVWFRRRRRTGSDLGVDPNAAMTLARLEAIGAALGRRRSANEGALTFASELATRTGDHRLDEAGPLVSGAVYGSTTTEPQLVSSRLAAVETSPPPPPPRPPLTKRILGLIRALPVTRRGAFVSAGALVGLGALAWWGVPLLGDLRDPVDRELAYVEQADAPDEWHTLMGTPISDLIAWQTCSSGYESDLLGAATAGLAHRAKPLAARVSAYGAEGALLRGVLNVGTDTMTAVIDVDSTRAGVGLTDEPWRLRDWPSVALQSFATVDTVLEAAGAHEPVRTDYIDRNGDHFARFESLPVDLEDFYSDDWISPMIMVDDVELMRVIDIWVDDEDVPVRVRMIDDGPKGHWIEWRLAEVTDARLVLPSCATERPWANADWIGTEPWTPTRSAPLQISVDANGNPFDSYSWESRDITDEFSGTIDGPISVLSLGDLNSISLDGDSGENNVYGAEYTVDLEWGAGAVVSLISDDEWPVATLISAPGESVVAWDEFESFVVYESFVTAVTAPTFREVDEDDLDLLLEPLWDGDLQTSASVDGEPGDELTVLTQSDASEIVVGRNADGQVVSILVNAGWIEWRVLGLEGTPPPSVLDRETQLADCLSGDREADLTGRCLWSD